MFWRLQVAIRLRYDPFDLTQLTLFVTCREYLLIQIIHYHLLSSSTTLVTFRELSIFVDLLVRQTCDLRLFHRGITVAELRRRKGHVHLKVIIGVVVAACVMNFIRD